MNGPRRIRKDWSTEEIERLKELWVAGRSIRIIARELGRTPGSTVGKLNRLGLLGGDRVTSTFTPKPKNAKNSWTDERLTEKWADRKKRKTR